MQYLPKDKNGNIYLPFSGFANKAVEDGKLFRRKHGFKAAAEIAHGAEGTVQLVVPYDKCKINEFEIINCLEGLTVDFKVHDTPTGTISQTLEATGFTAVPNLMLNQFGFDVELPNGFYRDKSDYDADVIKDMRIDLIFKNNTGQAITPKGNIVYHELK